MFYGVIIMIKLTILSENRDGCDLKGESGLSCYVEAFGKTFLLDTGYSDLFLKNAEKLGIDLSEIKTIVLTHGHSDHTNGLAYFHDKKTIVMHPAAFKDRWSIRKKEYVGLPMPEQELRQRYDVITSKMKQKSTTFISK